MIGKVLKENDYKFEYGKETVYVNVFGGFKYKKNASKYIVYSYDNNKLFYGNLFIRNDEVIVMTDKEDPSLIVKEFVSNILNNKKSDEFEIISLDKVKSIQIIDEASCDFDVDISKLKDLTIPKLESVVQVEEKPKKRKFSIVGVGIFLVFAIITLFFFVNPQFITGENKEYSCVKNYIHDKLPADVSEKVDLEFTSKGKIIDINIISDYQFNDSDYYTEFRDKNYFYQYFSDGDTYKFEDEDQIFRLFSKIDTEVDYFMPSDLDELIKYYEDNGYSCTLVEESEQL